MRSFEQNKGGGCAIIKTLLHFILISSLLQIRTILQQQTHFHFPNSPLKNHTKSCYQEMGNCQAIDNATLLIQHPKGSRVDKYYAPISANEIMKLHPGHYVALLLTTTLYNNSSATATATATAADDKKRMGLAKNNNTPLRVTRIKLLRPNDTLALGHVYRLITTKEVMNGLWAKKQAKLKQQKQAGHDEKCKMTDKEIDYYEALLKKAEEDKSKQVKHEKHRSRNNTSVNSASAAAASKSRAWQPSLKSISEAAS